MEIKARIKKKNKTSEVYRTFQCISCKKDFDVLENDIGRQVKSKEDTYTVQCPFCNIQMLHLIKDIAKIPYHAK